jgi:hypothetical protein
MRARSIARDLHHSADQKAEAEQVIRELEAAETFDRPIVTQAAPADTFIPRSSFTRTTTARIRTRRTVAR